MAEIINLHDFHGMEGLAVCLKCGKTFFEIKVDQEKGFQQIHGFRCAACGKMIHIELCINQGG